MVKLQKSTWRHYIRIWNALLGFVFRTALPGSRTDRLRHQLMNVQNVHLQKTLARGEEIVQLSASGETFGEEATSAMERASDALDNACLDLCISLLDHDLKGDLYESAIIGFLAALGIDPMKGILKEAYHFTPSISGFIKIAQMLVIQKSVIGGRESERLQPADLLDEMRARFSINGVRSPFS